MPNVPARRGVLSHEGSARCLIGRIVLAALAGASAAMVGPLRLAAQQADPPSIRVAPTIVAAANSEAVLAIEIAPLDADPASRSFVSLRGLPPTVALRDGHAVGPGLWAVPLSALPFLKAHIPATQAGQSDIVVSLIAVDGRLLAQATSKLVIRASLQAGPAAGPSPARAPAGAQATSAAPSPAPPESTAEQLARAERLLARGEAYLANGNIMGARDFFERAADAGLAASALQLAATYDPIELKRLKVQGVKPDVVLARKWYERARELGAAEAAAPLMRLGRN